MKRRILMMLAVTALLAGVAAGQTPAPKTAAPKTPAASTPAAGAGIEAMKTKIAILSFAALRELIGELKVKYDKLQAEFNPRAIELDALQNTIASQEKVLSENQSLTEVQGRKLADDIELKKREYQRKLEDSQEMARKRESEETAPILEKISDFLEKYCASHGITHVFDIGRLQETGSGLYVAPSANITEDFVKEYNKANPMPAGAAPAAPAPKKP
jgi:Skp family chaperone for outer membrane proteins